MVTHIGGCAGSDAPPVVPGDLPFREIAFAASCLAAGEGHTMIVPEVTIKDQYRFSTTGGAIFNGEEFVSDLASEVHLAGTSRGSAPEQTVYWMANVLIFLTSRLFEITALPEGIRNAEAYCQRNHPRERIDAILISVEHVVLLHIVSGVEVQHSSLMVLFELRYHDIVAALSHGISSDSNTSDVKGSCHTDEVRALAIDESLGEGERCTNMVATGEIEEPNVRCAGKTIDFGTHEDDRSHYVPPVSKFGYPRSTFYALVHIFEAAARRRLSRIKISGGEGRLPNEIYGTILDHVTDHETRSNFAGAMPAFRQQCIENVVVGNGKVLKPWEAVIEAPERFLLCDSAIGMAQKVRIQTLEVMAWCMKQPTMIKVLVGRGHNMKSVLPEVGFKFVVDS